MVSLYSVPTPSPIIFGKKMEGPTVTSYKNEEICTFCIVTILENPPNTACFPEI